jgi:hypothetical protein
MHTTDRKPRQQPTLPSRMEIWVAVASLIGALIAAIGLVRSLL